MQPIRKETEKTKEYAQNIIDSSLDMIIAVDNSHHIIEFNKAAQETFGYKKEEIEGKYILILFDDKEEWRKLSEHVLEKGKFIGEITNVRKNGEIFQSRVSTCVLRNQQGKIIGNMSNLREISERKRMETALSDNQERMHQAVIGANLGLWYWNIQTGAVTSNQQFVEMVVFFAFLT